MVSTVHQLQSQASHQADDEVPHQNKPSPIQTTSFFTKILASIKTTTQNEKTVNNNIPGSQSKHILRIARYVASKLQPAHGRSVT
jgi:hypothetical protein